MIAEIYKESKRSRTLYEIINYVKESTVVETAESKPLTDEMTDAET